MNSGRSRRSFRELSLRSRQRSERIFSERKNKFLLSLATVSFGSVVALAALAEERITVYVSILVLIYFAATLAFRVKRRGSFDFLTAALAIVFVVSILSSLI